MLDGNINLTERLAHQFQLYCQSSLNSDIQAVSQPQVNHFPTPGARENDLSGESLVL